MIRRMPWFKDGQISRPVYIVASPYKTATTTVGEALVTLGAGKKDMRYKAGLIKKYADPIRTLNREIKRKTDFDDWLAANETRVCQMLAGFTAHVAPFDIFSDAPFGHTQLHPFIRKAIAPKARFIWVNRPKDAWLASVRKWELSHPETYPKHDLWHTDPEAKIEMLMKRRRRQRLQFKALADARPDDCLTMHIDDLKTYDVLADFCGVPVPSAPVPRSNVSRS
ncbi:sulfotransferase [Yoonia sp. R2331]|uniref:sulfotransferase n=1 Tax=Yoonia sp. R2331 TaxID=3237238 RepID=UPI0034E4032B